MAAFRDLTGQRFDRLTVIERDTSQREAYWACRCDCGKTKTVRAGNLTSGQVRSCGCLQREKAGAKNIVGQRFGRWVVVSQAGSANASARWLCRCDCGVEGVVIGSNLRSGDSRSCGCLRVDSAKTTNRTHGRADSSVYSRWMGAKQRCGNPNNPSWRNYGGRGITMCDEWAKSFEAFCAYVGDPPSPDMTLDRIDNNGNYEPGNVRWATKSQQMKNRRPLQRISAAQMEEAQAEIAALRAELERVRGLTPTL